MAKKVAKTTNSSREAIGSAGTAPAKTTPLRAKKHLKAQAIGVAAAVEGFVHSITGPASGSVKETGGAAATETEINASTEVTHKDVSRLAYRYYLDRNGQAGSPADDWFRAEQALKVSGR